MQSSNPYTIAKQRSNRRFTLSTSIVALTAIVGGIFVDLYINPAHAGNTAAPTTSSQPNSTPADSKASGDVIQYRFGSIQVEVVRSGGKLTEVNLLQASASAGRSAAFPYLKQYALDAQGSNFSNLSGATYTTEAFKQALDSAISKLG